MRPSRIFRTLLAALGAMWVLGVGCGGSGEGDDAIGVQDPEAAPPEVANTKALRCRIGERPDYFVPATSGTVITIIGCARLGASGGSVEFSLNRESIGGDAHVCVNPAYPARGRLAGEYIPATCPSLPLKRRLEVVAFQPPTQSDRSYERVVWGTGQNDLGEVIARYGDDETRAAVFPVRHRLATGAELGRSFSLFVVELPNWTACGESTIEETADGASVRIPPRPAICRRFQREG